MKSSFRQNSIQIGWIKRNFINQLFKLIMNILSDMKTQLWDTQKSIEEEEKSAQKKEGLEKEIKESKINKTWCIVNAIF